MSDFDDSRRESGPDGGSWAADGDPSDDESLRRAVGKAIGIRRLELGLKRNDLRDRSGLSYPYIAELENGTKRGSTRALYAIATALEMEVSELMERAEALRLQDDESPSLAARSFASRPEPDGSWFTGERIFSERPRDHRVPTPAEEYAYRMRRRGSSSRGMSVEVDVDELADLIRQIVREELHRALRFGREGK